MATDPYSAVWVSHTSMSDFLKCPRAYYLRNMYKDPKTGHKIQLMSPPLALGQAVHEVIESLSVLPTKNRFTDSLLECYEEVWKKVSGKRGGFLDADTEHRYKERGEEMIRRVKNHPGPLANKAIKVKQTPVPHYWISEADNIVLCGKVDWLEYKEADDSVHIIDFKTSKSQEDGESLQLPIYLLLVQNIQKRKVSGASYWYLGLSDVLTPKELPDAVEAHERVLKIAKQIKLARQLNKLTCRTGSCRACSEMEMILEGQAEYVGTDETRRDIYIKKAKAEEDESVIL